jgi:hypothetical protein
MTEGLRMKQWHKELMSETAAMPGKQADIL